MTLVLGADSLKVVEVPTILIRRVRFALRLSNAPAESFDRHATFFEALAVRCARYAHTNLPPDVLQAFFHKNVTYPFLRFRMLRHLYLWSPVHWEEISDNTLSPPIKGIWIRNDATRDPDIVLYHIHGKFCVMYSALLLFVEISDWLTSAIGGGFVMGSTHFYLEYLMAFHSLLKQNYHNPAVFTIEYSLAPGARYPKQSREVLNGYIHALSVAKTGDRVCVMGDSAGGTLGLGLLSDLREAAMLHKKMYDRPGFMVLISPWMTLVSEAHRDSHDDYLSAESLHKFARLYAPEETGRGVRPAASPSAGIRTGWRSLGPKFGYYIWYGNNELLAPDIREAIQRLRKLGASVHVDMRESGGRNLHVWPLISFFLASDQNRRLEEMKTLVPAITSLMSTSVQ